MGAAINPLLVLGAALNAIAASLHVGCIVHVVGLVQVWSRL